MFVPIILGSDKTTVSVATGQNDYYPLYISLGNFTNSARRSHRNSVSLLGFLAIPKSVSRTFDVCYITNCFAQLHVDNLTLFCSANFGDSCFIRLYQLFFNH
jgi:hypothetical protein